MAVTRSMTKAKHYNLRCNEREIKPKRSKPGKKGSLKRLKKKQQGPLLPAKKTRRLEAARVDPECAEAGTSRVTRRGADRSRPFKSITNGNQGAAIVENRAAISQEPSDSENLEGSLSNEALGSGGLFVTTPDFMDQSLTPMHVNEIMAAVLKLLPVKVLKKARLVNKAWNDEASSVLKHRSYVFINPDSHLEKSKADFERLWASRTHPELSHPFQKVQVKCNGKFRTIPRVKIPLVLTKLNLAKEPRSSDRAFKLNSMLLPHVDTINYLRLENLQLEPVALLSNEQVHVQFPALESMCLEYWSEPMQEHTAGSIGKIIENSPKLKCLFIKSHFPHSVATLLQALPLTSMTSLTLCMGQVSAELADAINMTQSLPNLTALDIHKPRNTFCSASMAFPANFSPSLKYLRLRGFCKEKTHRLFLDTNVYLRLQSLQVDELDLSAAITPERFPALTTLVTTRLSSWTDIWTYTNVANFPSHPGLRVLKIRDSTQFERSMDYFALSTKFPRLTHVEAQFSLVAAFVNTIKSSDWFSSLTSLTICGYVRDQVLQLVTGYKEPVWLYQSDLNVSMANFRQSPSLRSFKSLAEVYWRVKLPFRDNVFINAICYVLQMNSQPFDMVALKKLEVELRRRCEKAATHAACKNKTRNIVCSIIHQNVFFDCGSDSKQGARKMFPAEHTF